MSKERKTQAVTLAVLAIAATLGIGAKNGWKLPDFSGAPIVAPAQPKAEATPQDTVYPMLDAARAGDAEGYLAKYSGQMETALRRSAAESGPDAFARYLRESNAAIKGVALSVACTRAPPVYASRTLSER